MKTGNSDIDVYVSLEVARQLKDRGFDSLIYGHYNPDGDLVVSDYKAIWVTPAPTQGQALEWLRRHNVFTSFYVQHDSELNKPTWQFEFYDRDMNVLATDSGLCVTDYGKCVDFAISYAVRFLIKQ